MVTFMSHYLGESMFKSAHYSLFCSLIYSDEVDGACMSLRAGSKADPKLDVLSKDLGNAVESRNPTQKRSEVWAGPLSFPANS